MLPAPPLKRPRRSLSKSHSRHERLPARPDFVDLASRYPEFAPHVRVSGSNATICWTDSDAQRQLSIALLHRYFNRSIELPPDRLCPPIPNRAQYVYWLGDLLQSNSPDVFSRSRVLGIDIGTGASCIYPLLGSAVFGWHFIATDVDQRSLDVARRNVHRNHLERVITLVLNRNRSTVFPAVFDDAGTGGSDEDDELAFSMCNPPFFEAMQQTGLNPKAVCTGSANELVTNGGEYAFIRTMIDESAMFRNRVRWFTTLVGRKRDLKLLQRYLTSKKISNVRTGQLTQGRTIRWMIAWSFSSDGLAKLLRSERRLLSDDRPLRACFKVGCSVSLAMKSLMAVQDSSGCLLNLESGSLLPWKGRVGDEVSSESFCIIDEFCVEPPFDGGERVSWTVFHVRWMEHVSPLPPSPAMVEDGAGSDGVESDGAGGCSNGVDVSSQRRLVEDALALDPENDELRAALREIDSIVALQKDILSMQKSAKHMVRGRGLLRLNVGVQGLPGGRTIMDVSGERLAPPHHDDDDDDVHKDGGVLFWDLLSCIKRCASFGGGA